MNSEGRFVMVGVFRLYRTEDAQIIHACCHFREEGADFNARFPVGTKIPLRTFEEHFEVSLAALEFIHRNRFACIRKEFRFGIP